MDEAILPSDYATAGVILDDELSATFLRVRAGRTVMLSFDCCHSATLLDLPHVLQAIAAQSRRNQAVIT